MIARVNSGESDDVGIEKEDEEEGEEEDEEAEKEDNFCVNCDLDDLTDTDEEQEEEMKMAEELQQHDQERMLKASSAGGESAGEEVVYLQSCCYCFTRRRPRGVGGRAPKEAGSDSNEPSTALHSSGQAVLRAHSASIPPQNKWDSKAAKTLSAILLAFIITWTPYNVLGEWIISVISLIYAKDIYSIS